MNKSEIGIEKARLEVEAKRLKDECAGLFAALTEILFRHDPMGINFETNTDEYEPEVRTILPRLKACRSVEDVGASVHEEFQRWFGADIAGTREKYKKIAGELWDLWQDHRGSSR